MKMPPIMPRLNKEQQAYQHAKDWWNVFAGIIIGGGLGFILGFELGFELAE